MWEMCGVARVDAGDSPACREHEKVATGTMLD